MNTESSSAWPSLVADAGDDFNFLEFPDLGVDFPALDAPADLDSAAGLASQPPHHLPEQGAGAQRYGGAKGPEMPAQSRQRQPPPQHHHIPSSQAQNGPPFYGHGRVPPTPNSMEMHGVHRHFPVADSQHAQAMYEAYHRKHQEQMVFTPLVSPAVTPLDQPFQMSDYTIPGEYFTPLTSPALQAQAHGAPPQQQHHQPPGASSYRSVYRPARSDQSDTISPIEMTFDTTFENSFATPPAKKSKRKSTSTAGTTGGTSAKAAASRAVRQSPAIRGQRRRNLSAASAHLLAPSDKSAAAGIAPAQALKLPHSHSRTTSESESLSPEPLLDALRQGMPPPAAPRSNSAGHSPYLTPQSNGQVQPPAGEPNQTTPQSRAANAPVTPSSLMNISKSGSTGPAPDVPDVPMQDLVLPEPAVGGAGGDGKASGTPNLHPLDTRVGDAQTTPTLASRKPAANGPASGNSTAHSIPPSPAVASATSPNAGGKADFRVPAKGKKRNSSSHQSPALRPRISPSIKPLLPEGAQLSAETSALLLASKSNYQNILEGTHLPGVSYPDALSENLTSKRTSHKIAEQGRRNRINSALQEMSALLPPAIHPGGSGSGGEGASPVGSGAGTAGTSGNGSGGAAAAASGASPVTPAANSKASTVEMAIDYIRALQAELKDVRGKLEVAEEKLGAKADA